MKLIDHILKTLPKTMTQYETIIQDHILKAYVKTIFQILSKKLNFFELLAKDTLKEFMFVLI